MPNCDEYWGRHPGRPEEVKAFTQQHQRHHKDTQYKENERKRKNYEDRALGSLNGSIQHSDRVKISSYFWNQDSESPGGSLARVTAITHFIFVLQCSRLRAMGADHWIC